MRFVILFLVSCARLHMVFASIESDCLEEHNFYRSKHGTPAFIQYNWELAKRAQKLANFLTKNEPSEKVTNGMYDANFFIASWPTVRTISDAVENWYIEGNSYNYTKPLISTDNHRFIELMWRSHASVGCGYAMNHQSGNVTTVVVAAYEPVAIAVNIDDFIENVLPPS